MSQKEARATSHRATEKDCEAEIQSIRREKLERSESEINDEGAQIIAR